MDAHTIDILSTLDPESTLPRVTHAMIQMDSRLSPWHERSKERFLSKYKRTGFGWYIATKFANHGMPFPLLLLGRDQWVFKAYLMKVDAVRDFNKHIVEAFHLAQVAHNSARLGTQLKAMLMSYDGTITAEQHLQSVAKRLGVPYNTVEAFEVLFFNVIDRFEDGMYLANEFYPQTRLVEVDENYLKNSSHDDLIKRIAYNHRNMDLTAYMLGLGDHSYLKKMAASDNREAELTRYLMGNGLMLSHANLLNQRSVGLSRVSTLLAASRQGGNAADEPPVGGIAPLFTLELHKAMDMNQDQVMRQMTIEAAQVGVTVDV
jgi:hypothetical protein